MKKTNKEVELKLPAYGGQAVMEGVMMRGKNHVAMAVRQKDGQIGTYQEVIAKPNRPKWTAYPFFRGSVVLVDSLNLGMRFLTKSANMIGEEEEKIEGKDLYITLGFSIIISVVLFFLLPAAVAGWFEDISGIGNWLSNLLEGVLRLLILISYLLIIGRMPEIKRTFAYHGAEHKTINAFEANAELTPEEVARYTLVHPRCGTSFLLTLVMISVLVFSLLGPMSIFWRLISRILMLPFVAGISYEYIRWAASQMDDSKFVQLLIKPNLILQKLTTREPSLDMLEVSISSFNLMYSAEKEEVSGLG